MHLTKLVFFVLLMSSCALTAPDGVKQLSKAIEEDRLKESQTYQDVYVGRPKFIKIRAYTRVEGGHIFEDHWIHLQIGRENLKIKELIER